jgi:hypothetical protein
MVSDIAVQVTAGLMPPAASSAASRIGHGRTGNGHSGAGTPASSAPESGIAGFLRRYWPFFLLVLLALVLRSPEYGDPDVSLDEEFYLVVADRMMHGALPFVDIWDRKPIGLFLIYAMTRLLGGEGFVQYQVVAALFAGATAGVIWAIARRATANFGAICAALSYLLWLNLFSGSAGQSPVFYNLFVAIAAWLAFRANDSDDWRRALRLGMGAMALCGIALQVKYTAVAEGALLGLWFLWRIWRGGGGLRGVILAGFVFALLGLAPTLLVSAYYVAIGQWHAFAYANFLSVFDRARMPERFLRRAGEFFLLVTVPLSICLPFAMARRWQLRLSGTGRQDFILMAGWLAAATFGFGMIGNFYDHYILPLMVPLFVCVAAILSRTPIGMTVAALLIGWPIAITGYPDFSYNRDKREKIMELTQATLPYVRQDRCLFIFDGPAILYMTTQACVPTRFVYPDHLSNEVEKHAIGADTVAEMKRVLDSRPGAIITAEAPVIPVMNKANVAQIRTRLMKDYVLVAAVDHPDRIFYVYALRSLAKGRGMSGPVPYVGY